MENPKTLPTAVYLDLEWDCGRRSLPNATPEIIEIGLAGLDRDSLNTISEENYLVRPNNVDINLHVSKLTGIDRNDLLRAHRLPEVIETIRSRWPQNATCFSWGNDGDILTRACHDRRLPTPFRRFVDLGILFQHLFLLRQPMSVRHALELLEISSVGEHMAVIDAHNILLIHAQLLRCLRSNERAQAGTIIVPGPDQPTWFGKRLLTSLDAPVLRFPSKPTPPQGKEDEHNACTRT